MKWNKAVLAMQAGYKIRRKSWLKHDFIYLNRGVLYCDGGYPYLGYLTNLAGQWGTYND